MVQSATMNHLWKVVPLLPLAAALIILAAGPGTVPLEEITVNSELQVQGLGGVSGSGRVTWTLEGEQARELRTMILMMFDESLTIPVGFPCEGDATGATAGSVDNGVIDEAEAVAFLDCVERVLVENNETFRFVDITSAELAGGVASLSSTGLIGSDGNMSSELQIRFVYDAEGRTTAFEQAGAGLARALHSVFDLSYSDNLQDVAICPPACRPFRVHNGWRVVDSPPGRYNWTAGRFMWHGNWTAAPWDVNANVYEYDAYNNSYYTKDGLSTDYLDLRFATSATFSFEHTGWAGEADGVEVKVRIPGISGTTDLVAVNDRDSLDELDNTTLDTLWTAVYDLTPWVGYEVEFRFRFNDERDGVERGPGYYLRNFLIEAPSGPGGFITFRHSESTLGFVSYYEFDTRNGRFSLIRTPVGEILSYEVSYPAAVPPKDYASAGYNILENPQALFASLLFFLWFDPYLQRRVFESYRDRKHGKDKIGLTHEPWILWSNRALLLLLVLLYFFPTLFVGVGIVIGGAAFWILGLFITFGMAVVARQWYARSEVMIIDEEEELPESPEPIVEVVEVKKEEKRRPVPTLSQGYNYLVFSEKPRVAYTWFNGFVVKGAPGLCMSTMYPAKVRQECGVPDSAEIVWLSDTSRQDGSLDPRRLDFEIFRAISRFFSSNPKGVFLLDGVEHLIVENGFDAIDRFLKKIADLASMSGATLLVPVSPSSLDAEQTSRLKNKFDHTKVVSSETSDMIVAGYL